MAQQTTQVASPDKEGVRSAVERIAAVAAGFVAVGGADGLVEKPRHAPAAGLAEADFLNVDLDFRGVVF